MREQWTPGSFFPSPRGAGNQATANIARAGLKGLVEAQLGWIFWMWCLAHRLELAVEDALRGTAFDAVDDMLLKLYYLYEKSPKNVESLRKSSLT